MVKFSLLMSLYDREKADFFNRAMQSIWDTQTIKPSEIILVEDGKLTEALYHAVAQWKEKLGEKLICVVLEKNRGLGEALNAGLAACSHDIVARMDTDDIAYDNRFEVQLKKAKWKFVEIEYQIFNIFSRNKKINRNSQNIIR